MNLLKFKVEGGMIMIEKAELNMTANWDKTFSKSEQVIHKKVTFQNRYGIQLAADLYAPKDAAGKLPRLRSAARSAQ